MSVIGIGARIKDLREKMGWTQQRLGDKIHVGKQTINGYESGYRGVSINSLLALSETFHVSTDYLLGKTKFDEGKDKQYLSLNGLKEDDVRLVSDLVNSLKDK